MFFITTKPERKTNGYKFIESGGKADNGSRYTGTAEAAYSCTEGEGDA